MTSVKTSPAATRVAPLPSIPVVRTDNPALNQCLDAMRTHLEVRQGERGNPWERAVTLRDLQALGVPQATIEVLAKAPATGVNRPPPTPATNPFKPGAAAGGGNAGADLDAEALATQIINTRLFQTLQRRLDDATRFDFLPQALQAALTRSIASEAAARGADIRRVEDVVRNGAAQFAQQIEEITAALQDAAAGVREVSAAYADGDRAVAGKVTQVEARLNGFNGGAASVEQVMTAVANRTAGLEAQYTVKVSAGGAVAGFGLAATSPVGGTPSSAFIVSADKFAVVQPGYSGGMTNAPASWQVPFSIDALNNLINMNGSVRVSGNLLSGGTITGVSFHTAPSGANRITISSIDHAINVYSSSGLAVDISGVSGSKFYANASNPGLQGVGNSVAPGIYAVSLYGGVPALEAQGSFRWGARTFAAPTSGLTSADVLRGDGTWGPASGGGGVSSFNGRTGAVSLTNADVVNATAGNTLAVNITGNAATASAVAGIPTSSLVLRGGATFTLTIPGLGTSSGCYIS